MRRLTDKVVLVTGGTSGIGAAVAQRLADEGGTVVIAARDTGRGKAMAASIGNGASFVHCDVTVEGDVARLVDTVIEEHGRLDAAFNNAGSTAVHGPITQISTRAWRDELEANLSSVFYCLKHEVAVMPAGGAIVNNGSLAAVGGIAGLAAYTAYSV